MNVSGRIVSVRVGRTATLDRPDWDRHAERQWRSAYVKDEVEGARRATTLGLVGDEQHDTAHHGGPQMALLAYAAAHYPKWRDELGQPAFPHGAFGENLVVEGFDERTVTVGDVFAMGGAVVRVTQPRGPCANISRRWNREDLLKRVTVTGRTGWYLAVVEEGDVRVGDEVTRRERGEGEWTIERILRLRLDPGADPDAVAVLAELPALSPEWRAKFAQLAERFGR